MALMKSHSETGVLAEETTGIVATVFTRFEPPPFLNHFPPMFRGTDHTRYRADTNEDLSFLQTDTHHGSSTDPHCESLPSWHFLWVNGVTSLSGASGLSLHFAEDFPAHKSSLLAAEEGDQAARVSSPLCRLQAGSFFSHDVV